MSILNVKPIAVGVAFLFFALIAGATADDANARRWNNQYNYNSGYGGGYYPYYRRYSRYRGGYYNNGWGWPNYGGIGFGFGFGNGFGYPYYSNRYYDNPYFLSPYYNNFPGYYDTPYYYRRSSTIGRCGAPMDEFMASLLRCQIPIVQSGDRQISDLLWTLEILQVIFTL